MAIPSRLKATMVRPMTPPPRKARVSALAGEVVAACVVLTLALRAAFMPMKIANWARRAPTMNPKAICQRGHMAISKRTAKPAMK